MGHRAFPVLAVVAMSVFAGLPSTAQAAFPGKNGKIAFGHANDIYTINPDGTGETNVTNDPAYDLQPAWSPDGKKIAFASFRSGNGDIYTINADGTGLLRITSDVASEGDPAWSPDGARIVFTRFADSRFAPTSLNIVNSDGTGRTSLPGYASNISANWSPDGSKIAFAGGGFKPFDIVTVDPAGTTVVNLTNSPSYDNQGPNWAPDGARIAFDSNRDGSFAIHTMKADGTDVIRITASLSTSGTPAWSPDGQKIAFQAMRDPSPNSFEIYVMNADGSDTTRVTNNAGSGQPDWQPLVGPERGAYKNAAKFCKAEREFLGEEAFTQTHGGGANAYGKCVSGS
jgi:Tol biopolymer transport system component